MKLKIQTINDCAEKVVIECKPTEFLIIQKGLMHLSTNFNIADWDREKAQEMKDTMPVFEELTKKK